MCRLLGDKGGRKGDKPHSLADKDKNEEVTSKFKFEFEFGFEFEVFEFESERTELGDNYPIRGVHQSEFLFGFVRQNKVKNQDGRAAYQSPFALRHLIQSNVYKRAPIKRFDNFSH